MRARWREARVAWRVRNAVRAEDVFGYTRPKNEREWRFCAIFVRRTMDLAMKRDRRVTGAIAREAGAQAVREAGYREKRPHAVAQRASEMLALPRIQAGIMDVMSAAGVDVAKIATMFAEILDAPLGGEDGVAAADKLKCAELFFKATTGFAVAKTATATTNVPVDAFFDDSAYRKTPPIKTVSET